ncbi:virally coded protein [Hydrangea ringspot virus]|uniref:Virally coded protein n=1 Tax=Hydrangea ringspot virus TaxID=112228 RepID=Q5DKQ8_9VIRU|nr:virally coded protein [Hydrangea ringspot virus]AAW30453.1 virally coded protein [Hydrangea ringspot virus]
MPGPPSESRRQKRPSTPSLWSTSVLTRALPQPPASLEPPPPPPSPCPPWPEPFWSWYPSESSVGTSPSTSGMLASPPTPPRLHGKLGISQRTRSLPASISSMGSSTRPPSSHPRGSSGSPRKQNGSPTQPPSPSTSLRQPPSAPTSRPPPPSLPVGD